MGRGLSEVQRWILHRAVERGRLYTVEVLAGFYEWQPDPPLAYREVNGERFLSYPQIRRFSPWWIGSAYNRTMAALNRSVRRLMERKLIVRANSDNRWITIEPTVRGRWWVKSAGVADE